VPDQSWSPIWRCSIW